MSVEFESELLSAAFETLPFEIALLNREGDILFVNNAWKEFGDANGTTHETYWVGENYLTTCYRADDSLATTVADALDALLAGDRDYFRIEYPCHSPDDQRWFLLEATAVRHRGDRYGIVAHVDITTRKRAELQRDAQITQLETIVNVLSHDLRNPLSIIRGHTEELETTDVDPETVAAIRESTDRMADLITTTLEFARTRSLNDVTRVTVSDVATAAWAQTPTADASLEVEGSRALVADESLLQQLFENLFRNSVEHGGPAVTVRIGTTDDGIYVEDDGPGIPAAEREQLLEGDVSQDAETGLGFAIVRAIVSAHDWSLSIHDGRTGGTRIEISDIDSIDGG